MDTPARVAKHPVHPMLVTIPIGLWVLSFVCDLALLGTGWKLWADASFVAVGGGIVGALAAAIPGWIDLWSLRDGDLFRTGLVHLAVNVLALLVYVMSFLARWIAAPLSVVFPLSLLGIIVLAVGGWLGGELVFVRGVAVSAER